MSFSLPISGSLLAVPTQSQSTASVSNVSVPEKDEIWSTILKSTASSKMTPTKNVLVLGDPGCGKSTLIHYLKHDPGPHTAMPDLNDDGTDVAATTDLPASIVPQNSYASKTVTSHLDQDVLDNLALGYTFVDVQDEENEAIARLGLYHLGLSSQEYLPLLKFVLSADTLEDAMVLIVLDWAKPWAFVEMLQRWFDVVQSVIDDICREGRAGESWSRGKAVVDELREKVEHCLQTYTEPSNAVSVAPSASTSSVLLTTAADHGSFPPTPVPNASTPSAALASVADQVKLPLTQGCLTTNLGIPVTIVCCKSDAFQTLEQAQEYKEEQFDYIQQTLRCICMKYGASLFYTSVRQPHTFHTVRQYILHRLLSTPSKAFPYAFKAQVIDRDVVLVPSGWDSWGKIRILREGFDCEGVHLGWDTDMEALEDRQVPGAHGARGTYEEAIPDPDAEEMPLHIPTTIACEDEQAFLDRHFETLQRAPDGPSRPGTGGAGVLSRPSLATPRLGAEREDEPTKSPRYKSPSLDKPVKMDPIQTTYGSPYPLTPSPSSPPHEVLNNFFQSLLSKKPTQFTGTPADGPGTRRPTISRNDVSRELDRMRQNVAKQ